MKQELTTTILTALVGVVAAFFITNMVVPSLQGISIKTLNDTLNYTLKEPDTEIFNYRAVNPTVEVYVGRCEAYDDNGNCILEEGVEINPNLTPNYYDEGLEELDDF